MRVRERWETEMDTDVSVLHGVSSIVAFHVSTQPTT